MDRRLHPRHGAETSSGPGPFTCLILLSLLVSGPISGCSPAADRPESIAVVDSAGWTIVSNRVPEWAKGEGWTVSPEPTMVLGVLSGPEEYQLTEVADVARLSDGSVVVVDRGIRSAGLYASSGEYLRTLGGPGSGPGEFVDPVSVLVVTGDTIVVWDQGLLRSTRFSPQGEVLGVHTVDWGRLAQGLGVGMESATGKADGKGTLAISGLVPGPMEPLGDGSFLVRLVEKTAQVPRSGRFRPGSGAVRVSRDLSSVDTLMLFGDTEQVVVNAPWGPFAVTPPWARRTQITHSDTPARVCIGEQKGPEVVCFAGQGNRTMVRWVSEPIPAPEEGLEAWREETIQDYQAKLSRAELRAVLDQVPVPERLPPYFAILLDSAGNLWVQRSPDRPRGARKEFLVFDLEGDLLGVVAVPGVEIMEVGRDFLLGIHRDDLGIQYVHMYELHAPSRGRHEPVSDSEDEVGSS